MTVIKETTVSRFIGNTADAKPTDVPVGSTLIDRQTGAKWICYDGTNWAQVDQLSQLGAGTAVIGKVGIDHTTPGTTDGVVATQGTAGTSPWPVNPMRLSPNGTNADQRLTVDATVGGVQFAALHADTTHVFWTNETAEARVTFDNSAPTSTNGHVIAADASGVWTSAMAAAAKFIRTGATSAVIHASQLKVV